MGRVNPDFEGARQVGEEIAARRKIAEKANAVPFGMEEITPAEARRRFEAKGPAERRLEIERDGIAAVIKRIGRQRG